MYNNQKSFEVKLYLLMLIQSRGNSIETE